MGAMFDYRILPNGKSRDYTARLWDDMVAVDLLDHGREGSGSIGMLEGEVTWMENKVFDFEDEAIKFLSKYHEKWSPALAVRLKDGRKENWIIGGWCWA